MRIKALSKETENFYKTIIKDNKKLNLYINYSVFNVNWMSELGILPEVIFDVGCNNGGDSIRFIQFWPGCEVHAFEADPTIYHQIKDYMEDEGVILSNVGVSNEDGKRDFYPAKVKNALKPVICGSGTFVKSRAEDGDSRLIFLESIKIKTTSLYTYCQKNNIEEIDLLHVDVEGWELNVMKGLKDIKPKVVFAEQHTLILTSEEINNFHEYMKNNNYVLKQVCNNTDYLYILGGDNENKDE